LRYWLPLFLHEEKSVPISIWLIVATKDGFPELLRGKTDRAIRDRDRKITNRWDKSAAANGFGAKG